MSLEPPEYDEDEIPSRGRLWIYVVAGVLVVSIAVAYGANALFSVAPSVLRSSGDPDSYAFLRRQPASSEPVRYDPCSPIRYVINRASAPDGAIDDLESAIRTFEDAMDVDFVSAGYTDEEARPDRRLYQPGRYGRKAWAPILFAWVAPERLLQPDDQAVGSAGSAYVKNDGGRFVYVTGIVTFNAEAKLLPGFELGASWGDVALHELGHIVGLAHVDDDRQAMYPDVTGGDARLGAGDLSGLEQLGPSSGCVDVPDPRLAG